MQIQAIIPASIKLISSIGISFVVNLIEARIEPVLVSEHCSQFNKCEHKSVDSGDEIVGVQAKQM